ncbi:MAG: kynureninase [Chloroflexota bacterium]
MIGTSEQESLRADATDPVPSMRDRFELPQARDGSSAIYVCGHSLGPLPRGARELIEEETDAWARLGVGGHFRAEAPWFTYSDLLAEPTARVVGARPPEVVTMNSLTVNLHQLFATFYRPTRARYKVLIEQGSFPSDRYAVVSQLRHHGVDADDGLVLAGPRDGEQVLRTTDIEALIERERDALALVWLPGVQYVTGQVLEIERITTAGHAVGALVGWDLAHAVGNVQLSMHDWAADFAVWCTYKYLNAGPGAVGQAFIHERWADDADLIRLAGWWGNDPETRFEMPFAFEPRAGAASWQASNPSILALAPLRASLALFEEVGIERLRERSVRLTSYLLNLLDELVGVEVVTPAAESERGAMLSLRVAHRSREVERGLADRGVILDFREPDIFRLALAPLYNTYHEAWRFVHLLRVVTAELG